jgi:ubiquinone/menaquinone biosynthesis C-methylase UbiE
MRPIPACLDLPRVISDPRDYLDNVVIDKPLISYKGPTAQRDSSELVSEMQNYLQNNSYVLDLGCGPRDQVIPIEYLGYKYVGVDFSNPAADFLADAHALPLKSKSFDCVMSYAVLEHLHNPFIAIKEIERILKPNGVFIGTVSQGEPFHESYFHHTAWGIFSLISTVTNMKIRRLWSSVDTIKSLSRMGKYPRVIKILLLILDWIHKKMPYLSPRKLNWSQYYKKLDELYRSGSICFVIQKSSEKVICRKSS